MKRWKYLDEVEFIWNGHYDDPQLKHKGKIYNCFLIEDQIYNDFKEFAEENNIEINDENFESYCQERPDQIREVFEDFGVEL